MFVTLLYYTKNYVMNLYQEFMSHILYIVQLFPFHCRNMTTLCDRLARLKRRLEEMERRIRRVRCNSVYVREIRALTSVFRLQSTQP